MNTYEKNLALLKSKFPAVWDWILKEEEDRRIEIIRTRSGLNNLCFKGFPGAPVCIYRREDPQAEEIERVASLEFAPDHLTFLIGIGLGYFIEAAKSKIKKGHKIVVFEPNASVLKKALAQVDLSAFIREDTLLFLPGEEIRGPLKDRIIDLTTQKVVQVAILPGSPRCFQASKEYQELNDRIHKFCTEVMSTFLTFVRSGRLFAQNEIANLFKFLLSPGIKNLYALFQDQPGFIISAGPSLEKNIHWLKKAEGKALLIATAPVVRVLLAHDIRPDLFVSVDFAEGNRVHFEGLWEGHDIPLLHHLHLDPSIVRDFQGDRFVMHYSNGWLSNYWEDKGSLEVSGSVSGWALKIAVALGCNPIIFAGQDLCFSDKTHVGGSARSRKFDPATQGEELLWREGLHGEQVQTSLRFLGFLSDMESTIAMHPRRYINASVQGLAIRCTEWMSLKECVLQFCRKSLNTRELIQKARKLERVNYPGLVQELESKHRKIEEMRVLCAESLKTTKKIEKKLTMGLLDDPQMEKLIFQNDERGERLHNFVNDFWPLRIWLAKEISESNRWDYIYHPEYGKQKNLEVFLRRNQLIFSAAQKALQELSRGVAELAKVFDRLGSLKERMEKNPEDGLIRFRYGRLLADWGAHRAAVKEYHRALELGLQQAAVYYELGRSSLALEKLKDAEEFFCKAESPGENPERLAQGLKEVAETQQIWLKKAESYWQDGNWINALLYARKVLRQDPACASARAIADAAVALREEKTAHRKAEEEQEEFQRENERERREWMARGKELFNRGNFLQAREVFQKVLQQDPGREEALNLLACCLAEMGEVDRAQEIFARLSSESAEAGLFLMNWARALLRNGRPLPAAEKFAQAAAKGDKYHCALFEAGQIYFQAGTYERAVSIFAQYVEKNPASYETWGKMGASYLAQGKLSSAKEAYFVALKICPDYEPARRGLKRIEELEKQGRTLSVSPEIR